ncbi:hypothetical protein ccbrp13_55030 [Ktedonobacteria bacterium brp13]|nr:hypothetical protein ccbrp13_55030 [Ktedonobacteria bacterium brp13]
MTLLWKPVTQRLFLSVSTLLFIVLLAACSSLGGTASSPTSTPIPSPTPALTMFTGKGYTISYPKDWTKSTTLGQDSFQDSQAANALGILIVANPGGVAKPSTVLDGSLVGAVKGANMTNTSPANLPASVSLAGETWIQKGTTGTVSKGGASAPFEVVVLATNHPAKTPQTRVFEFIYAGPVAGSTMLDAPIFQAMLASFKFTS